MRDRVRVCHFEPALLQIFAEIEDRSAHEQRALRINHDAHILRFDENIAIRRAIDQIHFVLEAGTAAADHRDPQRSVRATLFLQERREFARRVLRHPNETLVADFVFDLAVRRSGRGHKGNYAD